MAMRWYQHSRHGHEVGDLGEVEAAGRRTWRRRGRRSTARRRRRRRRAGPRGDAGERAGDDRRRRQRRGRAAANTRRPTSTARVWVRHERPGDAPSRTSSRRRPGMARRATASGSRSDGGAGTDGPVAFVRRMSSVVVQELRRTRRTRRLGSLEWFEVAYRVYLAALVGGGVVLWLSGLVVRRAGDARSRSPTSLDHGPAVLGAGVALAVALGLRSGSDGGPIAIEPPDVRHLLLAPVPRRDVLARPVVQRLRSVGVRRRPRRRRSPASSPPAACPARARRGRPAAPSPARRWARRSSPSPCSPTSLRVPRWLATGARRRSCSPPRPRRSPGGSRARRHHRQLRPVGHAPGAGRPRRHRRRRRARRRRRRCSPAACASSRSCAAATSSPSCASP